MRTKTIAPYAGKVAWKDGDLDIQQLNRDDLSTVFGDCYWMDTDEHETIAFYEYPKHEMQIELTLSGSIKRFTLTRSPMMADPELREAYNVDKPWPPEFNV